MGCSFSTSSGSNFKQFRTRTPMPVALSGFKELNGKNLLVCIQALHKTKLEDDRVMGENRARGLPAEEGMLLAGPYMLVLMDLDTKRKKKYPVINVGKEVEELKDELVRAVTTKNELNTFLAKRPEVYRRVVSCCFANRAALRASSLVFESALDREYIKANLLSFMSDERIRMIARLFLDMDLQRRGLVAHEDMADWVGARNDSLQNSVMFSLLPYVVHAKRPGFLRASEFVVFVDKLCCMDWSDAARFIFSQMVNTQTQMGDPAIDLVTLAKNNSLMGKASIGNATYLNLVLKKAAQKAYGKRPSTFGENAYSGGKKPKTDYTEAYRREQRLAGAAGDNIKRLQAKAREEQGKNLFFSADNATSTTMTKMTGAPPKKAKRSSVQAAAPDEEEYNGSVLTLRRHMWMAQNSPQYLFPIMFFQTLLRKTCFGEKFWISRRATVNRERDRLKGRSAELYNKNSIEAYLQRRSAEFTELRDVGGDLSKLMPTRLIDSEPEESKKDKNLDFKVAAMTSTEIAQHAKKLIQAEKAKAEERRNRKEQDEAKKTKESFLKEQLETRRAHARASSVSVAGTEERAPRTNFGKNRASFMRAMEHATAMGKPAAIAAAMAKKTATAQAGGAPKASAGDALATFAKRRASAAVAQSMGTKQSKRASRRLSQ